MRHKVIEVRQEVFNHNEHEVSKRWAFEEGVGLVFFFPLLMFYSFSPPLITIKLINLCFFRLRDRTSTSKPWRRLN